MEQKIWKLLVAIFLLMCASVLLLLAYILRVSFLSVPALILIFIGIFKGAFVMAEHRDEEKEKNCE